MTPTQLTKLTSMLKDRFEELSRRVRNRESIAIEKTPDVMDDIELSVERDLTVWSLDKGSAQLRYVRAALDRVAEGEYGVCLHCDEEINMKRLTAMPHASFCIKCQELAERDELSETGFSREPTAMGVGVA
jgi:DnaK suppressor protein